MFRVDPVRLFCVQLRRRGSHYSASRGSGRQPSHRPRLLHGSFQGATVHFGSSTRLRSRASAAVCKDTQLWPFLKSTRSSTRGALTASRRSCPVTASPRTQPCRSRVTSCPAAPPRSTSRSSASTPLSEATSLASSTTRAPPTWPYRWEPFFLPPPDRRLTV